LRSGGPDAKNSRVGAAWPAVQDKVYYTYSATEGDTIEVAKPKPPAYTAPASSVALAKRGVMLPSVLLSDSNMKVQLVLGGAFPPGARGQNPRPDPACPRGACCHLIFEGNMNAQLVLGGAFAPGAEAGAGCPRVFLSGSAASAGWACFFIIPFHHKPF
jgi:hypothetical protein